MPPMPGAERERIIMNATVAARRDDPTAGGLTLLRRRTTER